MGLVRRDRTGLVEVDRGPDHPLHGLVRERRGQISECLRHENVVGVEPKEHVRAEEPLRGLVDCRRDRVVHPAVGSRVPRDHKRGRIVTPGESHGPGADDLERAVGRPTILHVHVHADARQVLGCHRFEGRRQMARGVAGGDNNQKCGNAAHAQSINS